MPQGAHPPEAVGRRGFLQLLTAGGAALTLGGIAAWLGLTREGRDVGQQVLSALAGRDGSSNNPSAEVATQEIPTPTPDNPTNTPQPTPTETSTPTLTATPTPEFDLAQIDYVVDGLPLGVIDFNDKSAMALIDQRFPPNIAPLEEWARYEPGGEEFVDPSGTLQNIETVLVHAVVPTGLTLRYLEFDGGIREHIVDLRYPDANGQWFSLPIVVGWDGPRGSDTTVSASSLSSPRGFRPISRDTLFNDVLLPNTTVLVAVMYDNTKPLSQAGCVDVSGLIYDDSH